MSTAAKSIWSRKLDLIYLVFFFIHVPIMLTVDLAGYYPASICPTFVTNLRAWYIATYRDRYFTAPPPHFHVWLALEVVYHIPLSLWAVPALLRDDPLLPLHLLIWAVETALTTLVCVVDVCCWDGYRRDEVTALLGLYVPYLVLALGMGTDMFVRVKGQILGKMKTS